MESVCRQRERVCFEIEREREREGVCVAIERGCGEIERGSVRGQREVEIECVQNDRKVFMSRDRERVCREIERERVCVRMKIDIKGPLLVRATGWALTSPYRVRLGLGYGLGYQPFSPVFHFLTFCSLAFCRLAFCPGFDLVYTAEIRGQPLVLLYRMIYIT